jgi:hypothetical protein
MLLINSKESFLNEPPLVSGCLNAKNSTKFKASSLLESEFVHRSRINDNSLFTYEN